MDKNDSNNIVLELSDIRYLLVPPDFDPFSQRETEFMGEPAIMRIVKRMEPGLMRRKEKLHLTIKIPASQVKPSLKQEVYTSIHRMCRAKIEDNKMKLRTLRWRGLRALPFSFIFLAFCLGLGKLLGGGMLTFIPDTMQSVFSEGFTIIGWVSLWDPVETLLFDPIPIRRENDVLEYVMDLDIDIQAQSEKIQD
jgi:hypothetical protein